MNIWCRFLVLCSILFSISACEAKDVAKDLRIIPVPADVQFGKGVFYLNNKTQLESSGLPGSELLADMLNAYIHETTDWRLQNNPARKNGFVRFVQDETMELEAYHLYITTQGIEFRAASPNGFFYGVQTLLQILSDVRFYRAKDNAWVLPVLTIKDKPAFGYRGMMLDVSRHFAPPEFVKKCIDLMAFYKLNTFHWHLTDMGGWRIEMKKYPELTSDAAWRTNEDWLIWRYKEGKYYVNENIPGAYGGYYTQEEIKEVVAYAAERYITIIPEIEMPGHSDEVLAVYPNLSCYGKPNVNEELCAGNEETFTFLENVLTEVMELFPSEYIHIGGDEVVKKAWKQCAKCQERIRKEGLKDEKALHSYFMTRIAEFLKSKGRRMIGWDEILDGGKVAPEAIVMSWRGEKGGIQAATSGHDVIMAPEKNCYIDAYQAVPSTQPKARGGFTPYLQLYGYYPVPAVLNPEQRKHILGVQANLWTEFISTTEYMEYMLFPRVLSLAEIAWSPLETRQVDDFKRRVDAHIRLLKQKNVNVFPLSDRVDMEMTIDTVHHQVKVALLNERHNPEIRYTVDGTEPGPKSLLYQSPIEVKDSLKIKTKVYHQDGGGDEVTVLRADNHRAIGKKVTLKNKYSSSYPAAGNGTLTDGYRGGLTYMDGRWLGFLQNLDAVIDMGEVTDISYISIKFMQLKGPGVFMPEYTVFSVSDDGETFREVIRVMNDIPKDNPNLFFKDFAASVKARGRYIKIFAKKQAGFMFTDEVVVY